MALLLPVTGKMSPFKPICYFFKPSSSIWIPGFLSTNSIMLNAVNKKSDASLSDFLVGIGKGAHVTLKKTWLSTLQIFS